MQAVIAQTFSVGSTVFVTLQVTLPVDVDVRRDFNEISRVVRHAARSKTDDWQRNHYTVELSIVVVTEKACDEGEANLLSNAVCDALVIIPSSRMLWNGQSPWRK